MNNYVYIVSSMPAISSSSRTDSTLDPDTLIEEIESQLGSRDRDMLHLLLDGFDPEKIGAEFYEKARASKSAFIRDFFDFDFNVRNAKVRYLNSALGRPENTGIIPSGEECSAFEEAGRLQGILESDNILGREQALDEFMWEKIDSLSVFDYFNIDAILAFAAKLKIVDRWLKLDERTGRKMFHKLADEVMRTFKGVEFDSNRQ